MKNFWDWVAIIIVATIFITLLLIYGDPPA